MEKTNVNMNEINELRRLLNTLIMNKSSLQDPEIVETSRKLDNLLNEYEKKNSSDKK
jgi:hypothetical protein